MTPADYFPANRVCKCCGRAAAPGSLAHIQHNGTGVYVHPECYRTFPDADPANGKPAPSWLVEESFSVTTENGEEAFLIERLKRHLGTTGNFVLSNIALDDDLRQMIYLTGFAANTHAERLAAERDARDVMDFRRAAGMQEEPIIVVMYDDEPGGWGRIVDGNHRALWAMLRGEDTVPGALVNLSSLRGLNPPVYLPNTQAVLEYALQGTLSAC